MRGLRETFVERLLAGRAPVLTRAPVGRSGVAEAILAGGYPEAVARRDPGRRARWFEEYVAMTLERDVRDLARHAQQLPELPALLGLAAARAANLLSITAIASDLGMSRATTQRYLTLLEQLFLLVRARAWSRDIGQRLIKGPKLWLPDTGLACHLLDYDRCRFEDDDTALAGALFENFIATELMKQAARSAAGIRLHHFRTAGGREIDILLEARDGSVCGVEVKLSATVTGPNFTALRTLRDRLGARFRLGIVVHVGRDTLPFGEGMWAVPASGLWTPNTGGTPDTGE